MKIIDIDLLFERYVREQMKKDAGKFTEEEWEESLIKKARINFRPGTVLSNILGNLTFVKVKPKSSKADKEAAAEGEEAGE